jgi:hypothetical protein
MTFIHIIHIFNIQIHIRSISPITIHAYFYMLFFMRRAWQVSQSRVVKLLKTLLKMSTQSVSYIVTTDFELQMMGIQKALTYTVKLACKNSVIVIT